MRILYLHASLVPPPANVQADRFYLLSETLEGDVLQPIWFSKPEEVEAVFGPGSYPAHTVGRFRYHWCLAMARGGIWRKLSIFWFYLRKGLELHRQRPYDCIVVYSHMTTALFAALLKLLTGAKLIVEIVTAPHLIYLTDRPRPSWMDRAMHLYSDLCLHVSLLLGNRAHFLFPNQVSRYPLLRKTKNSVFHEFIPVSVIDRYPEQGKKDLYILLVGAPWYLKGVDLLIKAFQQIASEFPQVTLKILGHYPNQESLEHLIGKSSRIEVMKARPHPETLRIISQAAVMALPSRCEGLPRVLMEGMAAGIPLAGSDVAGIPFLIRDGENGFVVPSGDPLQLAARLRQLLVDPELRSQMGENGYRRAHTELNEKVYVEQFTRMVECTLQGAE